MNDRGHLSAMELDLLRLGSLSAAEESAAREHLAACARCRARHSEGEAAGERFEAVRAPAWPAIEARAAARRPFAPWRLLAPLAGVAAAAAVALFVVVATPSDPAPRVKGGPLLRVYALHAGQVRELRSGDRVAPGDRIRFAADPGEVARQLLVISVDGAGAASVYVPFDGAASVEVGPGRVELPDSVELDEVLGPERLHVFFSDRPLQAAPLREALAAGRAGDAAAPKASAVFELRKEAP